MQNLEEIPKTLEDLIDDEFHVVISKTADGFRASLNLLEEADRLSLCYDALGAIETADHPTVQAALDDLLESFQAGIEAVL